MQSAWRLDGESMAAHDVCLAACVRLLQPACTCDCDEETAVRGAVLLILLVHLPLCHGIGRRVSFAHKSGIKVHLQQPLMTGTAFPGHAPLHIKAGNQPASRRHMQGA